MKTCECSLQPEQFRPDPDRPQWAVFPNLHLLLGWGKGLVGTSHDYLADVHTLCMRLPKTKAEQVSLTRTCSDLPHGHARNIFVSGVRGKNFCVLRVNPKKRWRSMRQEGKPLTAITIDAALDHRVRANPNCLLLERRVSVERDRYIEDRTAELLIHPKLRPPQFFERRAELIIERADAIARREKNAIDEHLTEHTERELEIGTCRATARVEADNLPFDYRYQEVCRLDHYGITFP